MHLSELIFCDKCEQAIKYGLNDTKRKQKKQTKLYSFTPSDVNFQAILMPKVILAKFLSQKIYSLGPFLCFR